MFQGVGEQTLLELTILAPQVANFHPAPNRRREASAVHRFHEVVECPSLSDNLPRFPLLFNARDNRYGKVWKVGKNQRKQVQP